MKERQIEIKQMPEKEVLEDYLTGQKVGEPSGVCFDPQEGIFKRTMPKEKWEDMRIEWKNQEENYRNRVQSELQGLIND